MYTCTRACTHTCAHICPPTHVHMHTHFCMHSTCTSAHTLAHTSTYMCTLTCTHTYTCAHMPAHTHAHVFNSPLIKGSHGAEMGPCGLASVLDPEGYPAGDSTVAAPAAMGPAPHLQHHQDGRQRQGPRIALVVLSPVLARAPHGPASSAALLLAAHLASGTSTWWLLDREAESVPCPLCRCPVSSPGSPLTWRRLGPPLGRWPGGRCL